MSDRYLITPSLYSSWYYYHYAEEAAAQVEGDEPKRDQKAEFITTLKRESIEATPAMIAGREFEADVMLACMGGQPDLGSRMLDDDAYMRCVLEVAEHVRGGLWQERIMKDATFRNMPFLLYAKADVVKRHTVYDIKFVRQYEVGKYTNSVQHKIELVGSGLPNFKYLISDGRSVWAEDYHLNRDTEKELTGDLVDMVDNIMADKTFSALYIEHWKSFPDRPTAAQPPVTVEAKVNAMFEQAKAKKIAELKGDMRHD